MKAWFLVFSLAFCWAKGDEVHHLRGDAKAQTVTMAPAKEEVGAVAKEAGQVAEATPTSEKKETPAEVGAVAKEAESGKDMVPAVPAQESAKGGNEASQGTPKEAGVVAKEPTSKEPAASGEPEDEPIYYPFEEPEDEWGYDQDSEYIPGEARAQWDELDGYPYPEELEELEEPEVGVVLKELDPANGDSTAGCSHSHSCCSEELRWWPTPSARPPTRTPTWTPAWTPSWATARLPTSASAMPALGILLWRPLLHLVALSLAPSGGVPAKKVSVPATNRVAQIYGTLICD